jgi:murein endopeptidase
VAPPPPVPAFRIRRRIATATALGSTFTAFIALAAVGVASSPSDRPRATAGGASDGVQQVLGPETANDRQHGHVRWRNSRALGAPTAGTLRNATKLPAEGRHFVSWDPDRHRSPGPPWRRYGTDRLVRVVLRVAADYAHKYPGAPRLTIGDLSRRRGGNFKSAHASHENGLDADIYYPRRDGRERPPASVGEIDMKLAQDLVNRFVRAGAQYVFVGPNTSLTGRRGVVMVWPNHDNHLHVRMPAG